MTDLKNKMMKLWKDTFHDSDAYINIIFDNYFNLDYIEYYEEKNQIISALIGIPYEFGNGQYILKGLYLCGLATREEYRHKGIMSELIETINRKAKDKGFAFTFLIPASDMLRIFYINHGYVNGMYRLEERYTDIHDFNKDCIACINQEEERLRQYRLKYYEKMCVEKLIIDDKEEVKKVTKYITEKERENNSYVSLFHSSDDIKNIISENHISGGEILYSKTPEQEIKGVIFITFDDRKRMVIPKLYFDDQCAYYRLLDKAKKLHSESSMSIWRFPEETHRHALWSKVYGATNPDGGMLGGAYGIAERVYDVSLHSLPYGMIRILDNYEILKFLAEIRNDLKFSILVKEDANAKNGILYKVGAGKVECQHIDESKITNLQNSRSITVLSERDLSEILFRKKDGNSLILEAFGIPRLILNISLLLD